MITAYKKLTERAKRENVKDMVDYFLPEETFEGFLNDIPRTMCPSEFGLKGRYVQYDVGCTHNPETVTDNCYKCWHKAPKGAVWEAFVNVFVSIANKFKRDTKYFKQAAEIRALHEDIRRLREETRGSLQALEREVEDIDRRGFGIQCSTAMTAQPIAAPGEIDNEQEGEKE